MMRSLRFERGWAIILGICFCGAVEPLHAAPQYNIIPLCLTGPDYTSSYGRQYSTAQALNEAGQVIGYSNRYITYKDSGASAWFYDGLTTRALGPTGSDYIRNDGYQYSNALALNQAGQVIGYTNRYSGSSDFGASAWISNGSTTQTLGLTGTGYVRNDGYQSSQPKALNQAGQVIGYTNRYNGNLGLGQATWFYNGATTQVISLTGSEYTNSNGYQYSVAEAFNEAGQAIGYSKRFSGLNNRGESVWFFNGSTTQKLGLTGSEYTRSDGNQSSVPKALNQAGQVVGYSRRYNGSSDYGTAAWFFDGSTTQQLGLTGSEYTRNDGCQASYTQTLNEAGQVLGYSVRYGGSSELGLSAWLSQGSTLQTIGLTGTGYTRNDGYQYCLGLALNQAGQVMGYTNRYNGPTALGYSTWLFNGSTTQATGLTGSEYTRSDGYQHNEAVTFNAAGQVIGLAQRYQGDTSLGQAGWFYDDDLNQTFALIFSTAANGVVSTNPQYLSDTGVVLGWYNLYKTDGTSSINTFYWSLADGFYDLGDLVVDGLAANGWDALYRTLSRNGLGAIVGQGKLTSQGSGQMAYLLVPQQAPPAVPEPATWALLSSGLLLVGLLRRKKC